MSTTKDDLTLKALGLHSHAEALLCLPARYTDRTSIHLDLYQMPLDRPSMLSVHFVSFRGLDRVGNQTSSKCPASIEWQLRLANGQICSTRFFGMKVAQAEVIEGMNTTIQALAVEGFRERYIRNARLQRATGRVDPEYTGIGGKVSGDKVHALVKSALGSQTLQAEASAILLQSSTVNDALRNAGRSPSSLLCALHSPSSYEQGLRALAFARACSIKEIKSSAHQCHGGLDGTARYNIDRALKKAVASQAENLSRDQRLALNEIRKAINTSSGARVLLNGDVGSGKTLVFLLALIAVAKASGGRVAVLVPSELIARQIYAQASKRFEDIKVELCVSESVLVHSDARLVVGTQALLHRAARGDFEALVIDEQHKFSVEQRSLLADGVTHVIEASATPIPRSLALALFDGWTQARIERVPVPKIIRSHLLSGDTQREEAIKLIQHHLINGRRVIFLYPKVAGGSDSVEERAAALALRFPGKVAMLHGKMKSALKSNSLDKFVSGECPIVVASTAVEVGVDVPNIGLMIVSSAERFGMTQLHQLRGRLVRNGGEGDFVMLASSSLGKDSLNRLKAVRHNVSGFDLAEADLKHRGFGDVLGEMQSGKSQGTFRLTRLTPEDFINSLS